MFNKLLVLLREVFIAVDPDWKISRFDEDVFSLIALSQEVKVQADTGQFIGL